MYASERPQERAQCRTRSFTAVAVDLAHAVTIVVACPLVLSMIDGRVMQLHSVVVPVLVGVDDRPVTQDRFGQNALAGRLVAVADHPASLFTCLVADDMDDRWSVNTGTHTFGRRQNTMPARLLDMSRRRYTDSIG